MASIRRPRKSSYAVQWPTAGLQFRRPHHESGVAHKPSWYAVSKLDATIDPDLERFLARRMNATTIELDAGHLSLVSQPQHRDRRPDPCRRRRARIARNLLQSKTPREDRGVFLFVVPAKAATTIEATPAPAPTASPGSARSPARAWLRPGAGGCGRRGGGRLLGGPARAPAGPRPA